MTITLPLPPKGLSRNKNLHRRHKARLTKHARGVARVLTISQLNAAGLSIESLPTFRYYTLTFFHKVTRRRDDDNLDGSCKAYRDGIADALRIDDYSIKRTGEVEDFTDPAKPRLEITLLTEKP